WSARSARSPGAGPQTNARGGFLPRSSKFHCPPTRNMKGAEHDRRATSRNSVGLAARRVALEILSAVERRGRYADRTLCARSPTPRSPAHDAAGAGDHCMAREARLRAGAFLWSRPGWNTTRGVDHHADGLAADSISRPDSAPRGRIYLGGACKAKP